MDPSMRRRIDTLCVLGPGHESDPYTRAHRIPLYQTSTFLFETPDQGARIFRGEEEGYIYTRLGNPTIRYLEEKVALLENAEDGVAFSSGMAAIAGVLFSFVKAGGHLIASDPIYGGTFGLLKMLHEQFGIEVTYIKADRVPEELPRHLRANTRLVFIETPANPTLDIVDIRATAEIAHSHGLPVVVDNTFASPVLQRPIELGADLVVHSMTKYLNGHGDVVAGIVVGRKVDIERVRAWRNEMGANLGPFEAWLVLRGLKTLAIRVRKHSENALKVAQFLHDHPAVAKVYYPGLPDHKGHAIAKAQMQGGFSGMVSFILKGGLEAGKKLLTLVQIPALAVSLGDTDSLIEHPASMTHSSYSPEELREAGIDEGLVRLSVGLEDPEDLIADLKQALDRL